MSRDIHVRFCESLGVRLPRATRLSVFVRSPRSGVPVMASVRDFIERRLRLAVNEEKSSVSDPFDLTFPGFRLRRYSKGGEIAICLSDRTLDRITTRLREFTPRCSGNSVAVCLHRLNRHLNGWIGYFGPCTSAGASDFGITGCSHPTSSAGNPGASEESSASSIPSPAGSRCLPKTGVEDSLRSAWQLETKRQLGHSQCVLQRLVCRTPRFAV